MAILGKPGHRLSQYQSYEVSEKDLATRAVIEFSKLASGLLQGAVLLGLAEIRGNSRKILTKFEATLDPAFLTHRALLIPTNEDASDHILPLLVAEIQSILEDRFQSPLISEDLIEDWCDNHWTPAAHAKSLVPNKIREAAKRLCLKKEYGSIKSKNALILLLPSADSSAHHRFAELVSQRTHYLATQRHLRLGTVLQDAQKRYFLCLHPVCDSVRLPGKRHFVFVQLHDADSDSVEVSNGGKKVANGRTNLIVFESNTSCFAHFFSHF